MEVVDELLTPGCPNCAIKHLSAAIAHRVLDESEIPPPSRIEHVLAARAFINLIECAEGYESHFDYAVGLLQLAEDEAIQAGDVPFAVDKVRPARTNLILHGKAGLRDALFEPLFNPLESDIRAHSVMARAHLEEAYRELPAFFSCVPPAHLDVLRAMITAIRQDYFDFSPTVGGDDNKEEPKMATKKTTTTKKAPAAKKAADTKAAQAACKGGKCAGKKSCKK